MLSVVLACTTLFAQTETFVRQNQKGDQAARIGLALSVPIKPSMAKMGLGGSASLGYDYYINRNFFVGGEAAFTYNTTIADNVFYFVPVLFNATWQFDAGKFEIPCTLGLGGALQNYTNSIYFGVAIRPQLGVYYRINSEWSLGGSALVHVLPELFITKPEYNYVKAFAGAQISARYHF